MPSLTARLVQSLLGLTFARRIAPDEQQLLAAVNPGDPSIAPRLGKAVTVDARQVDGRHVFTVRPTKGPVRAHILYLHGGGYVNGPSFLHWWFIARMAKTFGASCTVPRYPLAPTVRCDESIAFVSDVYRRLADEVGAENIVVMGDSAGGGLALSLLQHSGVRPGGLMLNAPWLDAGVSDPTQADIERIDGLLSRFILRTWGQWWAGSRALSDPVVSPLFGDLSNLPPTLVFCGSKDILVADARRLAAAAPGKVRYIEEPGLMHVYPLLWFFPEARRAWSEIQRFVESAAAPGR